MVLRVFILRSSAEKLKIFDLTGAEELALLWFLYNLAQANDFRRDFELRLLSDLPYGIIGLN